MIDLYIVLYEGADLCELFYVVAEVIRHIESNNNNNHNHLMNNDKGPSLVLVSPGTF